jgi:hypothetical protein
MDTAWRRSHGIPRTMGYCPRFVVNIGSFSVCLPMSILVVTRCVIAPNSIGRPSMTSKIHGVFNLFNLILWWRVKLSSMKGNSRGSAIDQCVRADGFIINM